MTLEELNKKSDNWDFIVRDGEIKESLGYSSDICTGDTVLKLDNLIEIPNNATNGDILMTIFPNYHFEIQTVYVNDFFYKMIECLEADMYFDLDWWNAPYKTESECKE